MFHYDLYGKREAKYEFLNENSLGSIPYILIPNKAPNYFMVQKDFNQQKNYDTGFKVSDLFSLSSTGVLTAKDSITIDFNKERLFKRITDFHEKEADELRTLYGITKESADWSIANVKADLKSNYDKELITSYNYRLFDSRFIYYTGNHRGVIAAPRVKVMQHVFKKPNIELVLCRQTATSEWQHVFICRSLFDDSYLSNKTKERGYAFPLYLYPPDIQQHQNPEAGRVPNFNEGIISQIKSSLGLDFDDKIEHSNEKFSSNNGEQIAINQVFTPLNILDYIYAVLHSPSYRETYKEFLRIDFPKVPYPKNGSTFWQLVKLGGQLRQLHLLESRDVENYITQYPAGGDNLVEKISYREGKVYINDDQYFANVPDVVWNFYIGGYQPAQKWLKDRKGTALGLDEIRHYQKMVVSLFRTHEITQQIDRINFL